MSQSLARVYSYAFNIGFALLANAISKPKGGRALAEDFSPTTLATQGAMVPRLFGKRRIGCVFAWAGDRNAVGVTTGASGGGKGSRKRRTANKQIVYSEAAWQLLCVGPAKRLTKIWADGKVLWSGSLNSTDDPSGTSTALGDGSEFAIYWGEADQPVNTFLGSATRVGVSSRWPNICYIQWTAKALGPQPRWPQMEYELEVEPEQSTLNDPTSVVTGPPSGANPAHVLHEILFAEFPHGLSLDASEWDMSELIDLAEECEANSTPCSVITNEDEGAEALVARIMQDHGLMLVWNSRTPPGGGGGESILGAVTVYPSGYADGTATLDDISPINYPAGPVAGTYAGTFSATGSGSPYPGTGVNGVFVRLLSGKYSGDVQFIRVKALGPSAQEVLLFERNAVGVMFSAGVRDGGLAAEWLDQNVGPGEDYLCIPFDELDAVVLNETGTWDIWIEAETYFSDSPNNELEILAAIDMDEAAGGGWQFRRVREPCSTYDSVPEQYFPIPAGMIEGPLPEIEVVHAEQAADRLLFSFPDESREYRGSTIAIGDDSQAYYLDTTRARRVDLGTVVDFDAAALLAERRSQEELGPKTKYTLELSRGGRVLIPGDRILVSGISSVLRVAEIATRSLGGGAKVYALPDTYGVYQSDFVPPDGDAGGTAGPTATPVADLAKTFIEVPAHLLGAPGSAPAIVVPRIRANADQAFADIHISPDGTTYTQTEREQGIHSGGTLLEGLTATGWEIDTGPTFTVLGDDIGEVEDLSSNEAAWRLGRQVALINEELFFLKKVTLVSGTTYRLDGLIRARYDTQRAAHSIGDKVYIFGIDAIEFVQDPLLTPGTTLYVKPQPYAGTALSLASITAVSKTLAGKGIVPMRPAALRVTAPAAGCDGFATGNDISFRWAWRSAAIAGTGAGMQAAGRAVGESPLQSGEEFEIKFLTTGDVLKRTVNQSAVTYTYTNANLAADFGGEPSAFKIQVRQVNGGFKSPAIEKTITRQT